MCVCGVQHTKIIKMWVNMNAFEWVSKQSLQCDLIVVHWYCTDLFICQRYWLKKINACCHKNHLNTLRQAKNTLFTRSCKLFFSLIVPFLIFEETHWRSIDENECKNAIIADPLVSALCVCLTMQNETVTRKMTVTEPIVRRDTCMCNKVYSIFQISSLCVSCPPLQASREETQK